MESISGIVAFCTACLVVYFFLKLAFYVERRRSVSKLRRLEKEYRQCKEDCIYRCSHEDFVRKQQLFFEKEMAYAKCLRLHPEEIDKGKLIEKLELLRDQDLINEFLDIIFSIESKNAVDQR